MKVILFRGPANGKVMEVADHMRDIAIETSMVQRHPLTFDAYRYSMEYKSTRSIYRMKLMTSYVDGKHYYGPAMRPDGAVFFEWVNPKKK